MADYIYLLQTRLTPAQQKALATVRDVARARNLTVFLVGGAVRDLTSGSPIRDLDVVVQGNALKLKKELENAGGISVGESDTFQSLHFHFPGGVRLEVGSALSISYPKPGKPVARPANILDDLRRRDFTANAMAISLNQGSYGLLMDPMNGVADIENRELRLASNYGFIEDPSRMIRAARLSARLGWHMEERTQARYETGKGENYIAAMNSAARGYETEDILREEDPLRVLRRLESEGWMKDLYPSWTSAKANEAELNRLRDTVGQLNAMGIFPDPSAAYFPLLTAKFAPKEVAELKKSFARPGFVKQIEALEAESKAFGAQFSAKENSAPSATWKLLGSAIPESVLWLAYSSKSAPIQARFKAFFTEWPQARQRIPYTLMQEMRITPDLPGYAALVEQIFFAIMDGKLDLPEAAKAFLEPFSPPAPPPPINMRRRAVKREAKPAKSRSKKTPATIEDDDATLTIGAEAETAPASSPATAKAPAPANAKAEKPKDAPPVPAKAALRTPVKKSIKTPAKQVVKHAVPKQAAVNRPAPVAKKATVAKKASKSIASSTIAKTALLKTAAKKSKTIVAKPPAKAKVVAKSRTASKPVAVRKTAAATKAKPAPKPAPKPVPKKAPLKKASEKKAAPGSGKGKPAVKAKGRR